MSENTDPYGNLTFCVGNEDDFWCFDYFIEGANVTLHAVINSETGSFIQDAEKITVPSQDAVQNALRMIENAISWCAENEITHDIDGWNQSPYLFVEDLRKEINS